MPLIHPIFFTPLIMLILFLLGGYLRLMRRIARERRERLDFARRAAANAEQANINMARLLTHIRQLEDRLEVAEITALATYSSRLESSQLDESQSDDSSYPTWLIN